MAKIKFGTQQQWELEITPLTIWSNENSEVEFMEYQLGLYLEGKSVFNPELADKLVFVKDDQSEYIADFISKTLAEHTQQNWTPAEPKAVLFMAPLGCAPCAGGVTNPRELVVLDITLSENIWAGADNVFGQYTNTGMSLRVEATASAWSDFAAQIRQEEDDFDEDDDDFEEEA